jgi:hypothetical protein
MEDSVMRITTGRLSLICLSGLGLLWVLRPPALGQNAVTDNEPGLLERVNKLEQKVSELSADFGVGTVVFCSSETSPGPNWALCDGKTIFPSNAPQHLRGKPVPNLEGALLAVGDPKNPRVEGSLVKQSMGGEKFSLPDVTTKRIAADKGNATKPTFKGGLVAVFNANADYLDVKHNTAHWSCFGGQMNVEPANYEYHPAGTKMNGSADLLPPTHAYLQAYVRVK